MTNPLTSITTYFRGVQTEMRKVIWPTFPQLVQHLLSVVLGVALFTVIVGAIDFVFIKALAFFLTK